VSAGQAWLRQLASSGPIRIPTALVVAHQDDEMIAAAGSMTRLVDLTLIHATDGASQDAAELRAKGVASRAAYAAIRRAELDAALVAACVRPVRRLCYGIADRQVADRFDEVVERLAADLMSVDVVLTHPYEGGHVDHDALARAVHTAVATLRDLTGRAPDLLEFAGYYHQHGEVRTGMFRPDPDCPEQQLLLTPSALRRREAAFACFSSQRENLMYFSTLTECFRRAPSYDFSRPPDGL
jgi:LmbE family N-acetylglucosaminyl deacetylase